MMGVHTPMTVSVVVPCCNEEDCLPLFLEAMARTAVAIGRRHPGAGIELVLVDDGSRDRTRDICRHAAACAVDAADAGDAADAADAACVRWPFAVRWMSLSRNFGKEAALLAGLRAVTGEYVVTMDADLQDPPDLLADMLDMLLDDPDLDSVATRRTTRSGEPPIRSLCSRLFYRIMNLMSPVDVPDGARDFRMMRRPMADALAAMPERNRFTKGMTAWVGFRTAWIAYPNVRRAAGRTTWSFLRLAHYAIEGLVSCSTVPLAVASYIGILLCVAAFGTTCFIAVRAFAFGDQVAGWPSLACLITFIGGLQLMCLGVIGQYLAKTYLETKRRPAYIIRDGNVAMPVAGVAPVDAGAGPSAAGTKASAAVTTPVAAGTAPWTVAASVVRPPAPAGEGTACAAVAEPPAR